MKIYNLPFDLNNDLINKKDDLVLIRYYNSAHNTTKNKIILHHNMINLLISGTKTIYYPEATIEVNDTEFVILSSGNVMTSEILPGKEPFLSVLIYFSNDVFNKLLSKYKYLQDEILTVTKSCYLTYQKDLFVNNYIQSIRLGLAQSGGLSKELCYLKLEELFLHLMHRNPAKLLSFQILSKDDTDLKLKKAVEVNICNAITIEELAFLCNCSVSTFKRNFRRIYGNSPGKWMISRKLGLAADLLKHSKERPSQVYLKVGYENHSSFSEAFKIYYGLTPGDYQKQNLNL